MQQINSLSSVSNSSFIITEDGLYSFGYNNNGQLGLGNNTSQNIPHKITQFNSDTIVSIACGCYHSLVLTKDGLYSFGNNYFGQLGLGNNTHQNIPHKITQFNSNTIVSIACGYYHSFVLTKDGLYSFGHNNHGQLGFGNNINQNIPSIISIRNPLGWNNFVKEWSKKIHHLFNKKIKIKIFTIMMLSYRKESILHKLPKDVLYLIFNWIVLL